MGNSTENYSNYALKDREKNFSRSRLKDLRAMITVVRLSIT